MTEKQLLELKKKIETTKIEISTLKGRQDILMQQLKDQWGCDSIKQAEDKLLSLQKEVENLDAQIDQGLYELDAEYGNR